MSERNSTKKSNPDLAQTDNLYMTSQSKLVNTWAENLLDAYVPTGLLLNERYDILYIFGDAGQYLRFQDSQGTPNVLQMTHGDFHTTVQAALHRASRSKETIVFSHIQTIANDGEAILKITVKPLINKRYSTTHYFMALEPEEVPDQLAIPPIPSQIFDANEALQARNAALERELAQTNAYLQTTIEELETANEELQSTNEELTMSNEELQSTNEELHSVNEELYTVNAEYQRKIEELTQLTNDMQNLQRSTQIGVIFSG